MRAVRARSSALQHAHALTCSIAISCVRTRAPVAYIQRLLSSSIWLPPRPLIRPPSLGILLLCARGIVTTAVPQRGPPPVEGERPTRHFADYNQSDAAHHAVQEGTARTAAAIAIHTALRGADVPLANAAAALSVPVTLRRARRPWCLWWPSSSRARAPGSRLSAASPCASRACMRRAR